VPGRYQVVDDLGIVYCCQTAECLQLDEYVSETDEIGSISNAQRVAFVIDRYFTLPIMRDCPRC